jgi:hypothetical protein
MTEGRQVQRLFRVTPPRENVVYNEEDDGFILEGILERNNHHHNHK